MLRIIHGSAKVFIFELKLALGNVAICCALYGSPTLNISAIKIEKSKARLR